MVLHSSQDNIPDNEPISSVVVIQGSWTVYELINYGGQSKTIGVGYVNLWQLERSAPLPRTELVLK